MTNSEQFENDLLKMDVKQKRVLTEMREIVFMLAEYNEKHPLVGTFKKNQKKLLNAVKLCNEFEASYNKDREELGSILLKNTGNLGRLRKNVPTEQLKLLKSMADSCDQIIDSGLMDIGKIRSFLLSESSGTLDKIKGIASAISEGCKRGVDEIADFSVRAEKFLDKAGEDAEKGLEKLRKKCGELAKGVSSVALAPIRGVQNLIEALGDKADTVVYRMIQRKLASYDKLRSRVTSAYTNIENNNRDFSEGKYLIKKSLGLTKQAFSYTPKGITNKILGALKKAEFSIFGKKQALEDRRDTMLLNNEKLRAREQPEFSEEKAPVMG